MTEFKSGTVVRRRDGSTFPHDGTIAVVREPDAKATVPWGFRNMITWIEDGQWEMTSQLEIVSMSEVMKMAINWSKIGAASKVNPAETEAALRRDLLAELARRRRAEKRAATANSQIEPMRQELAKFKRETKNAHAMAMARNIWKQTDALHSTKIALIKEIVNNDYFMPPES